MNHKIPNELIRPVVYMVCTGNAARSPMAAAMLRALDTAGRLDIRSAGILVVEGHPIGVRTGRALARHGLTDRRHRSKQLRKSDCGDADLVVVMEPRHIQWVRVNLPEIAGITGSLRRLVRDLPTPIPAAVEQKDNAITAKTDVGTSRPYTNAEVVDAETTAESKTGINPSTHAEAVNVEDLKKRIAALQLADIDPAPWEEVVDPGFGVQEDFDSCSDELQQLVAELYHKF